ncbi:MAG: hypothetical protein M3P85_10745 [Actinomycetota bacterium]|nr:hypothetical protein [Actinomycetota bacterium]
MSKLSREEFAAQQSETLPDRKAMSVVSPDSVDVGTGASFTEDGDTTSFSEDATVNDDGDVSADADATAEEDGETLNVSQDASTTDLV